jgi:hypothetical protein
VAVWQCATRSPKTLREIVVAVPMVPVAGHHHSGLWQWHELHTLAHVHCYCKLHITNQRVDQHRIRCNTHVAKFRQQCTQSIPSNAGLYTASVHSECVNPAANMNGAKSHVSSATKAHNATRPITRITTLRMVL